MCFMYALWELLCVAHLRWCENACNVSGNVLCTKHEISKCGFCEEVERFQVGFVNLNLNKFWEWIFDDFILMFFKFYFNLKHKFLNFLTSFQPFSPNIRWTSINFNKICLISFPPKIILASSDFVTSILFSHTSQIQCIFGWKI